MYPVIAEPPVLAGADQDTATCEAPNTPDTPVGTPGTVAGTTAELAEEYELSPTMLVAFVQNT